MRVSKREHDYVAIAGFRAALRAFENAVEQAVEDAGITVQRYLLLLMVKGAPNGEERATINDVADRLKLEPNTVTGLVTRAEEAGLVTRERCSEDRRRMWIRLAPEGERRLEQVVAALDSRREHVVAALEEATRNARAIADARARRRR